MSDDLIKRLSRCFNGLEGLQTDQGDYGVLAEAATALAEAQAHIARLEDQVGDWIVRADEANARADRLEALIAQESEFLAAVQAKKDEYMMALASIRDNTCCEGCQEAARVARAVLVQGKAEGV